MPLILNIDTSTEQASICLSENVQCLGMRSNDTQKDHASWLHPAIEGLLKDTGRNLVDLKAVGITIGPGSYTGLRIGMATAKGLCYALNIPLIGINTLEAMASAALNEETDYICPMIDARRMEVFTAIYDKNLVPLLDPCAMILNEQSFFDLLQTKKIVFYGSGKNKLEAIIDQSNARFKNIIFNASHLYVIIYSKFIKYDFMPLAYLEPLYLKEHYTHNSGK
ncbi:MAG: tRNA (adenosine(37)-N6)-threonylcarbamoyltransferase complex dimerization subunit type 1 TsaB [Chitinophagaceae bacterium]